MAENYMPTPWEYEADSCPLDLPPQNVADNIIVLEEFRQKRIKQEVMQRMAESALQLCGSDSLDCVNIYTSEDAAGNILAHFASYDRGYGGNEYGVPHSGWSGPETYRLITATYDKSSHQVVAHELHPRNLKYVQSDIRAQERDRQHLEEVSQK